MVVRAEQEGCRGDLRLHCSDLQTCGDCAKCRCVVQRFRLITGIPLSSADKMNRALISSAVARCSTHRMNRENRKVALIFEPDNSWRVLSTRKGECPSLLAVDFEGFAVGWRDESTPARSDLVFNRNLPKCNIAAISRPMWNS